MWVSVADVSVTLRDFETRAAEPQDLKCKLLKIKSQWTLELFLFFSVLYEKRVFRDNVSSHNYGRIRYFKITSSMWLFVARPFYEKSGNPARTRAKHGRPLQTNRGDTATSQLHEWTDQRRGVKGKLGICCSVERLRNTLAKKVDEINDLKVRVQKLRFKEGEDGEEILRWSTDLEEKFSVL